MGNLFFFGGGPRRSKSLKKIRGKSGKNRKIANFLTENGLKSIGNSKKFL